jgi:hypothetical protein
MVEPFDRGSTAALGERRTSRGRDIDSVPRLAPPEAPLSDGVGTLRAWRADDAQAVVAALQDREIPRWTSVPSLSGIPEFEAWMDEQAQQQTSGLGLHPLVVDRHDRLLGAVGVQ